MGLRPGLRLRVSLNEVRWSVLTNGVDGRRIRIPIGQWPSVDLECARSQARRLKRAMERPADEDDADLSVGRLLDLYDGRRLVQLRKGAG